MKAKFECKEKGCKWSCVAISDYYEHFCASVFTAMRGLVQHQIDNHSEVVAENNISGVLIENKNG